MKKYNIITLIVILITPMLLMFNVSMALAQSTKSFLSIPASAFTGQDGGHAVYGYEGNITGTSRSFNVRVFAPVNLPHGAYVTSLQCGGRAYFHRSIVFHLRRNEPQQANVDMATVKTSLDGTGFEFVNTNSITSGEINNSKYNYYIVAEIEDTRDNPNTAAFCPNKPVPDPLLPKISECRVNFCSIGYTLGGGGLDPTVNQPVPDDGGFNPDAGQ